MKEAGLKHDASDRLISFRFTIGINHSNRHLRDFLAFEQRSEIFKEWDKRPFANVRFILQNIRDTGGYRLSEIGMTKYCKVACYIM